MFRIIDKRGSGKTSRLMLLAKEQNAIIVCANPRNHMEKAHAYGITGLEFISYRDFIERSLFNDGKKYLIDDMEYLFNYYHPDIIGYTITED